MPGPGHRFQPGQSGNPGGHPKAAKGLPTRIRMATGEGLEVVEFHRAVMADTKAAYSDRKASADWLIYWGFGAEPFFEDDESEEAKVLPFGLTDLSPPDDDS